MVNGLIQGLLISVAAAPALAAISVAIWLAVLYRRAVQAEKQERRSGDETVNETKARENRAHVRRLLREKQPALAMLLGAAPSYPCGPGCRANRWCKCALNPEARFHGEDCPVAPGAQLRFTGAEMIARLGLEGVRP